MTHEEALQKLRAEPEPITNENLVRRMAEDILLITALRSDRTVRVYPPASVQDKKSSV